MYTRLGVSFWDDSLQRASSPRVRVAGVGSDSVLYDSVTVSSMLLPLHDADSVTEYNVLVYAADTLCSDTVFTLRVEHTPLPRYVSPECGCAMFHEIKEASFSGNGVSKTVTVLSTQVTTEADEIHLQIHR